MTRRAVRPSSGKRETPGDPETALADKLIFQLCAEGNGPGKIARMTREPKIITPGTLAFQRTGHTNHYDPDHPCQGSESSIASICEQKAYCRYTIEM